MKHIFTPQGEAALQAVMCLRPLLAFDFDGTLAPIVARPDEASVSREVSRCLTELGREFPVAIITGRSVADVRPRLGFKPRFVIGNHGGEDPGSDAPATPSDALDRLRQRIAGRSALLQAAGVWVEDKQFSLALHYRLAADAQAARACIDALLTGCEPALARFGGKFVVNVVAAGTPDKGDALATLMARAKVVATVFVGDDVNDEAVFGRTAPPSLTIRIGRDDPSSKAMYFLDSDAELVLVLRRMLAPLGQG